VVTAAVNPAAQLHGLAGGIGAQVAASVAAHAEGRVKISTDYHIPPNRLDQRGLPIGSGSLDNAKRIARKSGVTRNGCFESDLCLAQR
jgi:hypothetical protein